MSPVHIPTLLLLIGFPVYWLELYVFRCPGGTTSWLAPIVFAVFAGAVLFLRKDLPLPAGPRSQPRPFPLWFLVPAAFFGAVIVAVALYAALLPPHLPQEYDVINYHITIPRQHLILHSMKHLPWSAADLYLSPLGYALAPYWLATPLPNKFPQFIFLLGLLAVAARLAAHMAPPQHRRQAAGITVFALLGTHALGVQAGTGMLDVVACYLFFAAVDSILQRRMALAALECAFFVWSKSFMPLWILAAVTGTALLVWVYVRGVKGGVWSLGFVAGQQLPGDWKRFAAVFVAAGCLVAGPFAARSLGHTGTPLYPLGCGAFNAALKDSPVCVKARTIMAVRHTYGAGRSLGAFLTHLWWIAVPERGVNNRYDYPLGLTFLLFLLPFCALTLQALCDKKFPLLPVFLMLVWAAWWAGGSQQSRFLFVPLVGMMVCGAAGLTARQAVGRIFLAVLLTALALNAASVLRAHKADWGRPIQDVLRPEDKALLQRPVPAGNTPVAVDGPDAAFAAFPIDVPDKGTDFVLEH